MAFGDSANWIGRVPTASARTEFKIEFECKLKGQGKPSTCEFSVFSHETERDVAPEHCKRWNEQNGGGASNESGNPNRYHRVCFDGEVVKMGVKGYRAGCPAPPNFTDVKFGEKIKVLEGADGNNLCVFNA